MDCPCAQNEMMKTDIVIDKAPLNIDNNIDSAEQRQNENGFNNDNNHHHKDNKKVFFSQKVILNEKLKESFSVSDAKYNEDCNCGPSTYIEVLTHDQHKRLFKNPNKLNLQLFQYVIIQTENGVDAGSVISCGVDAEQRLRCCYNNEEPENFILRPANNEDMNKINKNKQEEPTVLERTKDLVSQHKLEMKVTNAEWQYDRQRLTVFFTAPQRIDFRELVKDLARTFRTRIELRQISTREEAKRIGGMGPCGLNLCCSSFVNEFCHVTLDHARHQHLSNNVAKLSGYCGRLKCCLLYEHDTYVEVYDKFPAVNSKVITEEGEAYLNKVDIFKEEGILYYPVTGIYKNIPKEELTALAKNGKVIAPPEEELRAKEKDLYDLEELKILEAEY